MVATSQEGSSVEVDHAYARLKIARKLYYTLQLRRALHGADDV